MTNFRHDSYSVTCRKLGICPGCGKADCLAPVLVKGDHGYNACGFDLSAFEDNCANQVEYRHRPIAKFNYSSLKDTGESRYNPLGYISHEILEDEGEHGGWW